MIYPHSNRLFLAEGFYRTPLSSHWLATLLSSDAVPLPAPVDDDFDPADCAHYTFTDPETGEECGGGYGTFDDALAATDDRYDLWYACRPEDATQLEVGAPKAFASSLVEFAKWPEMFDLPKGVSDGNEPLKPHGPHLSLP